jgi:hypothetical protein
MLLNAWETAYARAIHESNAARQILLVGLAVNACSRRLIDVSFVPISDEYRRVLIALEDLKLPIYLNRKYG